MCFRLGLDLEMVLESARAALESKDSEIANTSSIIPVRNGINDTIYDLRIVR